MDASSPVRSRASVWFSNSPSTQKSRDSAWSTDGYRGNSTAGTRPHGQSAYNRYDGQYFVNEENTDESHYQRRGEQHRQRLFEDDNLLTNKKQRPTPLNEYSRTAQNYDDEDFQYFPSDENEEDLVEKETDKTTKRKFPAKKTATAKDGNIQDGQQNEEGHTEKNVHYEKNPNKEKDKRTKRRRRQLSDQESKSS